MLRRQARTETANDLGRTKSPFPQCDRGLTAAIMLVVDATWQRCRVHFMRNALAYLPKDQSTVIAAAIR